MCRLDVIIKRMEDGTPVRQDAFVGADGSATSHSPDLDVYVQVSPQFRDYANPTTRTAWTERGGKVAVWVEGSDKPIPLNVPGYFHLLRVERVYTSKQGTRMAECLVAKGGERKLARLPLN